MTPAGAARRGVLIVALAVAGLLLSGCHSPRPDRAELKAELRKELRKELLAELRADLRKERAAVRREAPATPATPAAGPLGGAAGRMLRSGQGLPGCRVQLVRLAGMGLPVFESYREGPAYVTVTDDEGRFRFERLPVGKYKIKWELPGDRGWIRRIRDRPDVTVREGKTSVVKAIETSRPLLPR